MNPKSLSRTVDHGAAEHLNPPPKVQQILPECNKVVIQLASLSLMHQDVNP